MSYLRDAKRLRELKTALQIADMEQKTAQANARTALFAMQSENARRFLNSGYSHGGASSGATWAKEYYSESLSPKSDIEVNRKLLRERTRDLSMNSPIGAAAINTTRTNVIGTGLVPKPKIDFEFLGMSRERATDLQRTIKKEFSLWAESTLCDICDLHNFYELQQIAFRDWLVNGEAFALLTYSAAVNYMPYTLRLRLVAADRICTPGSTNGDYDGVDLTSKNGNRIMNGVELDKEGRVIAYHISSSFPGEYDVDVQKWTRVEKRGKRTGNPNVLHIFSADTAEQYRGVPYLAPVIKEIKQLTRYTEAEVMAAVINAMFSVFITTETGNDVEGFSGIDEEWSAVPHGGNDAPKLGNGTISYLKEGEKVQPVETSHPNGSYETFLSAFCMLVGSAIEISPEVLMKKFTNNFSASKGAINETWKSFSMRRKWFVDDFCQEVYELWFAEAVSSGRIQAPGFFTDPLIRKSYTNATWTGPAQGCLDPVKEINAAVTRIAHGISTHEDECAAINGSDYEDNIRTLETENEELAKANGCTSTSV